MQENLKTKLKHFGALLSSFLMTFLDVFRRFYDVLVFFVVFMTFYRCWCSWKTLAQPKESSSSVVLIKRSWFLQFLTLLFLVQINKLFLSTFRKLKFFVVNNCLLLRDIIVFLRIDCIYKPLSLLYWEVFYYIGKS